MTFKCIAGFDRCPFTGMHMESLVGCEHKDYCLKMNKVQYQILFNRFGFRELEGYVRIFKKKKEKRI